MILLVGCSNSAYSGVLLGPDLQRPIQVGRRWGTRAALASDNKIVILDEARFVSTYAVVDSVELRGRWRLPKHENFLAFSKDGTVLASDGGEAVQLRTASDGAPLFQLPIRGAKSLDIRGKVLAAATHRGIELWDLGSREGRPCLHCDNAVLGEIGDGGEFVWLAFPVERDRFGVTILDIRTGQMSSIDTINGYGGPVAWLPGARLGYLAGGSFNEWDGNSVKQWPLQDREDHLVAGARPETILLWDSSGRYVVEARRSDGSWVTHYSLEHNASVRDVIADGERVFVVAQQSVLRHE